MIVCAKLRWKEVSSSVCGADRQIRSPPPQPTFPPLSNLPTI